MQYEARVRPTGCRGPLLVLLQTVLLLQLATTNVAGLKMHAPPGAGGGQLVLSEGDTLTLSCEDSAEVLISYPDFSLYDLSLPEVFLRNKGGVWNSTLTLRTVYPAYTGYYNCSSTQPNAMDAESLYVYVRSNRKDRPWVLDSDDRKRQQAQDSALLHTMARLDCRANDPATSVRLRDAKNRTLTLGRQPDGTELSWNPRVGFLLGPVEMRHAGTYWCAADGSSRDLQVKLHVIGVELVAPSVWLDRESPSVARGSDVMLTCELAMVQRVDFNLTWTAPTGRVNEGYRWMAVGVANGSNSWHMGTKLLYIFNVKDSDAGDYTCTADDGRGNRKSATFRLEVQGAPVRDGATAGIPASAVGDEHQGHRVHASSSGRKLNVNASLLLVATLYILLALIVSDKID